MRRVLVASALLLPALALLAFRLPGNAAQLDVEFTQGHLSVSADGAPLSQILREVARRTGVRIVGADGLQDATSVRLSNLSVSDVLRRLLGGMSYVLVEEGSPQGRTRTTLARVFDEGPPTRPFPGAAPAQRGPAPKPWAEPKREHPYGTPLLMPGEVNAGVAAPAPGEATEGLEQEAAPHNEAETESSDE